MTDEEKNALKQEIINDLKNESTDITELESTTSLGGLTSLPAMQGSKMVLAPIGALAQPAIDAAATANTAAGNASVAAEGANAAKDAANTAATKANEAKDAANTAAEKANTAADEAQKVIDGAMLHRILSESEYGDIPVDERDPKTIYMTTEGEQQQP